MSLWFEESTLYNATSMPKPIEIAQAIAIQAFMSPTKKLSIYSMHCQLARIDKIAAAKSTLVHTR